MSGPVTPFKSPNEGKLGARGADSQGFDRERGTGKALFTSPVLNQQILSRPLEPIQDAEVTLDLGQPVDVNGKSPTAALFATPPLPVRWKRPRQQASSTSSETVAGAEQHALVAASSPQASDTWLSGKTQRDLFSTPEDQIQLGPRRRVVDFGALVAEGLLAQQQLASGSADPLSDTESEEPMRMETSAEACQAPRQWSASEEASFARLVAMYAEPAQKGVEEATPQSMEDELQEFVNQHSVASAAMRLSS